MIEHYNIPDSWAWTTLGQITEVVDKVQPRNDPKSLFTYIDISSIDNALNKIVEPKKYTGKDAPSRARQHIKTGDTLFSTVRVYLRNIALVEEKYDGQVASTGFCVLRSITPVDPVYVFYYMMTQTVIESLSKLQRGTSYPAVRNGDVFAQAIPIPPAAEQKRIVFKIDELFSRLAAGVKFLKNAKVQMESYQQSLLKGAFTGRLTRSWRNANPELSEAVDANNGKPKWVPESWAWTTVGELFEVVTGNTPRKSNQEYYGGKHSFYKPPDLNAGYHVNQSADTLTEAGLAKARSIPEGSVLVTCIGTIGRIGLVRKAGACNQQINAILPNEKTIPEFVYYICKSPQFHKQMLDNASATTLSILNKGRFKRLHMPIPPLEEQRYMVDVLDAAIMGSEACRREIDVSLSRSKELRANTLSNAFNGQLVKQNPKDEPAHLLLERMKSEC